MLSNSTSILTKSGYGLGGGNGFGLDSSFSPSIQHNSYNSSTTATNTIGNFKGVMLCNRPFDGVIGRKDNRSSILQKNNRYPGKTSQEASNSTNKNDTVHFSSGGERSFVCGTVAKPWGYCNTKSASLKQECDDGDEYDGDYFFPFGKNAHPLKKKSNGGRTLKSKTSQLISSRISKKDGALSKHKKWLFDLQKEKERREKMRLTQDRRKESKKKSFMEREARKRQMYKENTENYQRIDEEEKEISSRVDLNDNNKSQVQARPAWALTASCAKDNENSKREQEEEELLNFVQELNIDDFSNDLELRVLMDQVKSRIKTLQDEKDMDESQLQAILDNEMAMARESNGVISIDNIRAALEGDLHNSHGEYDDEINSVAESVKSSSSDINSIHSRKSLKALVAKSKERISSGCNNLSTIYDNEEDSDNNQQCYVIREEPRVVTHQDDEGARIAATKSLSKLPFKNRNPAL